ncbi:TetR/AcrR family transcriptional regulator, partial [Lawsonibacter sp. OA9]|nr:TetR/AcrR family transcriptional regulator [Lawsonibacter sp. OA9]
LWLELLEEGQRDGSIHTEYAKEISELLPLLTNLWAAPSIFPASQEEMFCKFAFIKEMLERMGVPLLDDEIMQQVRNSLKKLALEE